MFLIRMQMCRAILLLPILWICVDLSLGIEPDYYRILGVTSNATPREIKQAFRKQAVKYHPDKNKQPGAEEMFQKINDAHKVLMDSHKRQMYDMRNHVRRSSSSSQTSEPEGFTFHFNPKYGNFHNFFGHDFNKVKPPFHFNQRKFNGRPGEHPQHRSFFSFDDFFEDADLGFGDFFGGGDAYGFGSDSSFFGSHFGGCSCEPSYNCRRAEPVNHEFYPHHKQSRWSSTHKHCQMEKILKGNRITTTIRCS